MRRKLLSLLLAVCAALPLAGCGGLDVGIIGGGDGPTEIILDGAGYSFEEPEDAPETDLDVQPAGPEALPEEEAAAIDEDGTYNSVEDVSLYLHTYDHLPENYITKSEARNLGWTGGSVEQVAPGCAIGGDRFGNREGILPAAQGRSYYECDIGTIGESSRGAKRLVYSDDGLIYYTEDHYETFTLLYGEEAP
ncbi:MAG: ribonuclease [Oscillospiraceae bacterium]|jgi:ribonuclease T1|nr:ribonuclease [Oscillospiraceae bacterium]MCI9392716.1 ribonuclease [Oscillospiraceae bacterium]